MILPLKAFLAKHQLVSLQQLARAFETEHATLEPILERLVAKGLIEPYQPCQNCQMVCQQCSVTTNRWYQWCQSA